MALLACFVTAGVLLVFSVAGQLVFKVMGITMPAFQIAASIVLLLVALDMLRAQRSRVQETHEETKAGMEKTDIAVTPLAIPMLAGPGAISTTILLQNEAKNIPATHRALRLHPDGLAGELSDFTNRGPRHPVVEPDCDEHRHPHHGIIAGIGRHSIHAERHQNFSRGVDFTINHVNSSPAAKSTVARRMRELFFKGR